MSVATTTVDPGTTPGSVRKMQAVDSPRGDKKAKPRKVTAKSVYQDACKALSPRRATLNDVRDSARRERVQGCGWALWRADAIGCLFQVAEAEHQKANEGKGRITFNAFVTANEGKLDIARAQLYRERTLLDWYTGTLILNKIGTGEKVTLPKPRAADLARGVKPALARLRDLKVELGCLKPKPKKEPEVPSTEEQERIRQAKESGDVFKALLASLITPLGLIASVPVDKRKDVILDLAKRAGLCVTFTEPEGK